MPESESGPEGQGMPEKQALPLGQPAPLGQGCVVAQVMTASLYVSPQNHVFAVGASVGADVVGFGLTVGGNVGAGLPVGSSVGCGPEFVGASVGAGLRHRGRLMP